MAAGAAKFTRIRRVMAISPGRSGRARHLCPFQSKTGLVPVPHGPRAVQPPLSKGPPAVQPALGKRPLAASQELGGEIRCEMRLHR